MEPMKPSSFTPFFLALLSLLSLLPLVLRSRASELLDGGGDTSIIFTTLGRLDYAFDIFSLPVSSKSTNADELRVTDGQSVNFNGHFPSLSPAVLPLLLPSDQNPGTAPASPPHLQIIYVTERNGTSSIYLDSVYYSGGEVQGRSTMGSSVDFRVQVPLLSADPESHARVSMKDRPSLVGERVVYVSTHEDPGVPRASWSAVYSTHLRTGLTRRLTPHGVADFSPAVSPSGDWTAVASYGGKGWDGDVEELATDIYAFRTLDGSGRVMLVQHGGWPSWSDDSTLYFHRRADDGWWSAYRAVLPSGGPTRAVDSALIERLTPPGLHVFTPAASAGDKSFIAVATRRPGSNFRHIELFDVELRQFREVTRRISPGTHHFNPFISPDSSRVGYHRCRGTDNGRGSPHLFLENLQTPSPGVSLFRIDGSFPSFSPDGDRVAFVGFPGLYVANLDGSDRREVFSGAAWSTAWDPVRKGVVYTSTGPDFASERTKVDVISVDVDGGGGYKTLTLGGQNNAFPSPSPDGRRVVFRSGRSGHKNLYIMDAVEGERGGLVRLTEGAWTDTMCNWSPDGEWIAFASDRADPGGGSFELFLIRPDGSGLRRLFRSGVGGRANHPSFSPDGKSVVFTSDYAGVSAEPVSNPHHYQPYGDIFTMGTDGSRLRRLTHNSYEDGTPTWGPKFLNPADVLAGPPRCGFEDCHWLAIDGVSPPDLNLLVPAAGRPCRC